jgi:NYN domain-containing protein
MNTTFSLMEGKEITATFTKNFFILQKLAQPLSRRQGDNAPSLQKLVQPLMAYVTKGEISKCDPEAFSRFVTEASKLTVAVTQANTFSQDNSESSALPVGVMESCIWLCSLAKAGPASAATVLEAGGAWIYVNLTGDDETAMAKPKEFLDELLVALAPLGLEDSDISGRARIEFVSYIGQRLSFEKPTLDEAITQAKEWCVELLSLYPNVYELKEAAKALDVLLPEEAKGTSESDQRSQTFTPNIFAPLRQIPAEDLQGEWEICLTELLGVSDDVLGKQTARHVRQLTPETPHIEAAEAMDTVAWDIWASYWSKGIQDSLTAAQQFAEFSYTVQKLNGMGCGQRVPTLHLILNLQLPKLLQISGLEPIRAEFDPIIRNEGCTPNIKALLAGIIQAVAGACHAAELANNIDDRDTLLTLHGAHLRQMHKEYERLSRDRHTPETEAWRYLEPRITEVLGEDGDSRPKMDQNMVRLVNRGNHNDVLKYIGTQLDFYRSALEKKLTHHRLSGDFLMQPTGRLYIPQGRGLIPAFEIGQRLLKAGEFERAAAEFDEIANQKRIGPVQQSISRDYQAYALARLDKFIQAKPLLRGLCDTNYRFPSAYWNLACIETERQDQLTALLLGLERAPHLNMLEAAVYLGAILDQRTDEQVCNWLSLTPFLEALMLQYHHESSRLDDDEKGRRKRDDLLKRIASYIQYGDPEVPDPTDIKTPVEAISDLNDSLKQRDHLEVIGFWFRCHGPYEGRFRDGRARTEYYKLRTDIFNDLGQPDEAAASFQDEMDSHLDFLDFLIGRNGPSRLPSSLLQEIRLRLERELRICMAPNLESVGRKLYRLVQEWENQQERKVVLLLDESPQRKIHEFYSGGVETLERVLIRISGELRKNLHDAKDYPRQRPALTDLLRSLETASKQQCAQALRNQLEKWDKFIQATSPEDRKTAATEAQVAYNQLLGAFQQQLSPEQFEMANGILYAINRVNGRHTPGPKVFVTSAPEAAPTFRGDGQISTFSLRVNTEKGSAEARLLNAVARTQDTGHVFRLRDRLDMVPVLLGPDKNALLSFEDDGVVHTTDVCYLDVDLTYEYLGQTIQTPAIKVAVEPVSRPAVNIGSPYIFGRELYPEEIEGRFFGRDIEQRTILELLTGTSNKFGYIEGIRKTGKTSLFNSIRHQISLKGEDVEGKGSKLILIHLKGGSVGAFSQVGLIFHFFLSEICSEPQVAAAGIVPPQEDVCCTNMLSAYRQFETQLRERLPGYRVVAFWDDFQNIVDLAEELSMQNQGFLASTRAFLNVIRDERRANSSLIWLLAGFRFWLRFITQVPNVNLWAEIEPIPIDFLGLDAVRDIIVMPLSGTPIVVTPEAISRVYQYTQGYPDVVQRMANSMLERAQRENRYALTPADADAAAIDISKTQGIFADSWCPLGELSSTQRTLIGSFINVVKQMGGSMEPHRLVGSGDYTETVKKEVEGLLARKIITRHDDGATIMVKAPVLEMWMRNHWKDEEPPLTAAVFIDLANLTEGTGMDELEFPGLSFGDVVPGTFKLKTVLDAIDSYAADLVPSPVTEKWAINYPPGSRAVPILNLNRYQVENIDKTLFEKGKIERGSDDVVLMSKLAVITSDRPAITHVVLVTGDKDLKIVGVELQLKRGKSVHILTRRNSTANDLKRLANLYPQRCKLVYLEELLEKHQNQQ